MEKENLKEINLNVDEIFRLELGGESSGGYAWEYTIDGSKANVSSEMLNLA